VREIGKLHAQRVEAKNAYWTTEVEVSGLAALAWTRLAQGKADEAEQRMRAAGQGGREGRRAARARGGELAPK